MSHSNKSNKASWRLLISGLFIAAVAVVVVIKGISERMHHEAVLQQKASSQDILTVSVIKPAHGPSEQNLILPGDVLPYAEAPIYARVNGYLKAWYTDIGAHVKSGQLLAVIDTPELDQQIHRAEADLASAEASLELAKSTSVRWLDMLSTDSVSHQDAEEKTGDAKVKQAIVNALRANLYALRAQQTFNRVVAPFDGVITDRKTDIGMLINAGSSGGGQALFRLAKIDKLRAYVEVPQNFTSFIKSGLTAQLKFPESPSRSFSAKFVTTSSAVDQTTRTLTVELLVNNEDGEILPGTYAEFHFNLPTKTTVFRLPSDTLLFRKDGMEVATVSPDGHVVLKPITIGRDLGTSVEVISGIDGSEQVIDSPSDSLMQGDQVRVVSGDFSTTVKKL